MRKRKKTVTAVEGKSHAVLVHADYDTWNDFEVIRKLERIPTRAEAFRLLMKRAVNRKRIKT